MASRLLMHSVTVWICQKFRWRCTAIYQYWHDCSRMTTWRSHLPCAVVCPG